MQIIYLDTNTVSSRKSEYDTEAQGQQKSSNGD